MSEDHRPTPAPWPALDYAAGRDTLTTLHLWSQIVGKVRLAVSPWINHSWHATLYPDARGLTTGPIPHPARVFELIFDFQAQRLRVETGDGDGRSLALEPRSVASFHDELMAQLAELGVRVRIHGKPNELPDPVTPFAEDTEPRAYVGDEARLVHRALLQTQRVFLDFRAGFQGKVSPVHLFWGSFDLAVTRFSGRPAPPHPGGFPNLPDRITREAYSHEVSSAGFWAGNEMVPYAAYYAYAYPSPEGFGAAQVGPEAAFFHQELGEFLLPYEAVRTADDPDAALMRFLEDTYVAAADLAGWDREALERERGAPKD
ncbi:MAG TPA: DUF5996 family protein [Thermoanaerobaculia bacterium]|nr:DUF5996 family protein [Thermoanaerobaculia bacterium]